MAEDNPRRSPLKVAVVIALYWAISISMVFIMKHLLSGSYGNQDLTIFVTWYQSASVVVVILLMSVVARVTRFNAKFPRLDTETVLSSEMLSLSFTFVVSLTMNNLMLKHIGVSFYQVARSLTLIFSILLSMCMLWTSRPSLKVMISVLLVISGFVVGVDQEEASGTITLWGIIYGILASFTSALAGIYFKRAESVAGGSALKVAYINNLNSMFIISPLVISTSQLPSLFRTGVGSEPSLWVFLTLSGVLSLAIGWVSALQIRYTSPVTHQVSINAKSTAQTVIAILWHGESKTWGWWLGNLLVVAGILMYAFAKTKENQGSKKKQMDVEIGSKNGSKNGLQMFQSEICVPEKTTT